MKLDENQANLFFKLMWCLQFYVNRHLDIYPEIKNLEHYVDSDHDEKMQVRKALYENPHLIDSFIQENPYNLSENDLSIIASWKKFIKGQFFIERLLKKYAIFIQEDNVYGVLGISQDFDELIHRSHLPLSVETVLLPFDGKMIYDGLFEFHNIHFGGGVKNRLKETYLRAKQNSRIISSLETPAKKPKKPDTDMLKNWTPELDELAGKASKLKGSSKHPAIYSPAFSLVKASIEFARLAASDTDDKETLQEALRKVRRAFNRSSTVLYRED